GAEVHQGSWTVPMRKGRGHDRKNQAEVQCAVQGRGGAVGRPVRLADCGGGQRVGYQSRNAGELGAQLPGRTSWARAAAHPERSRAACKPLLYSPIFADGDKTCSACESSEHDPKARRHIITGGVNEPVRNERRKAAKNCYPDV